MSGSDSDQNWWGIDSLYAGSLGIPPVSEEKLPEPTLHCECGVTKTYGKEYDKYSDFHSSWCACSTKPARPTIERK